MTRRPAAPWWSKLDQEELLDVRLCDLGIDIPGTALEARIARLWRELERAGLRFRPHVWLSTGWFTPDGVPGFAAPFYLAHPRLARLEHKQMYEVEGGTQRWCMKLLRHEAGHAFDNAYGLHRKALWRKTFGNYSEPYRWQYRPNPGSRRFVQHLDFWYAQSHPAEDWAESFAVWLGPRATWRREYEGWPALAKLEAVDSIVADLRGAAMVTRTRRKPGALSTERITLREHYKARKRAFVKDEPAEIDTELLRLFSDERIHARRPAAATFLRERRQELRARVSELTGQYRYDVDQSLRMMMSRCKELGLRLSRSEAESRIGAAILLTMLSTLSARGRQEFHR
ncbi:MAG: hypothetical protein R3F49_04275 [Planctomycetota bacterium]